MLEFSEFIVDMNLIDLPSLGNKYTWFNLGGDSMSRIDRFLISEGLIDSWGINVQSIGDRSISDHCPIFVKSGNLNWGPNPFKFFSTWIEHPGFCR